MTVFEDEKKHDMWVLCETADGNVRECSLSLIATARSLNREGNVTAAVAGYEIEGSGNSVFNAGADKVYLIDHPDLAQSCEHTAAVAFAALLRQHRPAAVLMSATVFGRAVAPHIAALLETGLTADCTGLSFGNGILYQMRPAFGGNLMAEIVCKTAGLQMATVRPFAVEAEELPRTGETVRVPYAGGPFPGRRIHWQPEKQRASLRGADIIVAGGLGVGSRKGFDRLRELADFVGGEMGASRAAVNAGFSPYGAQVGQTGACVRPRVYVAFGISGAVQHLAGVSSADYIIAVNHDPQARIFEHADLGIVCDWQQGVDAIIKMLQKGRE